MEAHGSFHVIYSWKLQLMEAMEASTSGVKRSHETTFIEADALPLSEPFARSYTAFRRAN